MLRFYSSRSAFDNPHSKRPMELLVISLLSCRQLVRFVVRLAVELLHFLAKVRAVVALGIGQRPRLSFVIPVVGIEALRFLEMRNRIGAFSLLVEILPESELGISTRTFVAVRFQTRL